MPERAYTVAEIDEMRGFVETLVRGVGHWTVMPSGGLMGRYLDHMNQREYDACIEGRLRTYMVNGTAPDELREAADKIKNADREAADRARNQPVPSAWGL